MNRRELLTGAALLAGVGQANAFGLGGLGGNFGQGGRPLGGVGSAPPNLFWVGGAGNWSQASHWAATSGGAGGAGIPGSNSNVTFDANSGTSATVTVDVAAQAKSVTINKSDLTLIDNAGMTVPGAVTLTTGALNTNGKTENWGSFASSSAATRTLTLTNSTINLAATNATALLTAATNMTSTLTGSTINCTGFSAGFVPGALVFPNVNLTGAGNSTIGSGTYGNLTFLGDNNPLFDNVLGPGTLTITGTFTVKGISQNNRVLVDAQNTPRTITAAAVVLQNVEFRNVTGAGAATWAGTIVGDVGGNSGITFTTATTKYWIGNGGSWSDGNHWSASSGGAAAGLVPLPQDAARFDANSFTLPGQSITMDYSEYSAMDWTGVTNTPNMYLFEGGNFCGNVTLSPNMTTSGGSFVGMTWFKCGATGTLTTNGVGFAAGIGVKAIGGSFTLQDDFVQLHNADDTFGIYVHAGTFNANNRNVTLVGPVTNIGNGNVTRALTMGTGTWTLKALTGAIWNMSATGMTLTSTGSTLKVAAPSAPTGNRTFVGAGLTYNKFEWAPEGVASTLIITGANTFNDFKVDADAVPRTLTLPASTTTTSTTIELSGSLGNLLSINSSAPGTQATLSQASGTVTGDFLSIKDSAATGGAAWTATHSNDNGNNTGWGISA